MKCLDLFSGTHSVANALKEKGHEVVTLDLKDSDININILQWEYWKDYPKGYFDYIHGSPPCDTFSICRKCWIGRKIKAHGDETFTKELYLQDQLNIGVPILNKLLDIIKYFEPTYYTVENPQTGDMKKYISDEYKFTDIDYCMYGFPYKKRTRIWNNFNFNGEKCNKNCGFVIDGRHQSNCGNTRTAQKVGDDFLSTDLKTRYRIPNKLINSWINEMK